MGKSTLSLIYFGVVGSILIIILSARTSFHFLIPTWTGFEKKTLWDWLQIAGSLAIPFAVVWYGTRQSHDIQIATDNQRETSLQIYFDKMSELLLEKDFPYLEQNPHSSNHNQTEIKKAQYKRVRSLATARTVTVLSNLDPIRKKILYQFLSASGLLGKFSLYDADFSQVDLRNENLSKLDLRGIKLNEANLAGCYFVGTNLHHADLKKANLRHTSLKEADLSCARLSEANLLCSDLSNADFHEADLKNAKVTGEQLSKVKSFAGAIMPSSTFLDLLTWGKLYSEVSKLPQLDKEKSGKHNGI